MPVDDQTYRYDPAIYFVISVDLPAVGQVHPLADGGSYLAVSLTLAPVTTELLDAWLRMDKPNEIAARSPVYEKEILFLILEGPLIFPRFYRLYPYF
ncbi:AraC family transcriptional regulator [Salinimonas sediminis]|uniref:AraC family transcriptional regulator n=1 Tax=Salinimonas sediminis TaxID=2303538 RepID=A0A346NNQ4_9ALTE|nr:AraC family transcriptional regulator [Salinimonas sediminis]